MSSANPMDPSTPSFYANSRIPGSGNDSTSTPLFYSTNSSNDSDVSVLAPFSKATVVVYTMVFIVGFLGNTLAIYVVARYAKIKTVTNIYILNLALADELYILGVPFIVTNSVLSYWPYGDFLCKVCMTVDTMSQFASTFCLTLMSIDRFLAVVYPIRSAKWRKPHMAKIFSGMVWVVSFLTVLPVTIFSIVLEDLGTCNIRWPDPMKEVWSVVFILYTSILGFFGPLVVISICYLFIVFKVKSVGARAGLTKKRKSERKVTRMVVIIVLVFVLCWLPFFTFNIVNQFFTVPETQITFITYFALVILTYVNSCANPVLYAFLSDNFKQSFQEMLCFRKPNTTMATSSKVDRHNGAKSVQMEVNRNPDSEPFAAKTVIV